MVNRYKLELTNLEQEILNFLFIKRGETFTARAIAVALHVSPPGIGKAIKNLQKEAYVEITKNKETKRLSIHLNEENNILTGLKRSYNLKLLYETGLVEELKKSFPGTTIIVFGSYSLGEDTIRSDIDIAIIGAQKKEIDLTRFEKKIEREISLHFYESFKKIDKHLLNNIINGITMKGAMEL